MKTETMTRNVHYVLSTHWDREWYQSFQNYRFQLVRLFDRILEGLETGRLAGPFQTDGQAIVLEDYLEVRPERRAQLERFVRERKLIVGPWYVLPDEFLVSAESHVRNIRMGREIARKFGSEPSNAGFVCDLFGHISQLPQIFRGFGIENAFTWRGINLDAKHHFIWTGADGTETVVYKFCHFGYCDYSFRVRNAHQVEAPFDEKAVRENLDKFLEGESSETEIDAILLFDGGDHQEWDERTYTIFKERMGKPGEFNIRHTSLDEYIPEMIAQKDRISVRLSGELREPGRTPHLASHLIPGVLSSRIWIKQANAHCQTMLCQWAEPTSALATALAGAEYPYGFLEVSWRNLLQNHPHDSICGCSIDQVHEDMKYRFSQSSQLSERLTVEATRLIAANIAGEVTDQELRVVVFNPLAVPFEQTAELLLEIPIDWATFGEFFGFEQKPAFRLYTADGTEVPYQRVGQTPNRNRQRAFQNRFPQVYKVNEVRVSVDLRIAAMGYTTLIARPGKPSEVTRHAQDTGLATTHRSMENEFLNVVIENNGTLTITDKRTGSVYNEVLTFEECADIGDGWFHGPALNDQTVVSSACQADIALLENGPRVTAFRIRTTMRVPGEFDFVLMRRSDKLVELTFDTVVRLRPGTDYLEVETTVDNTACDHRVRVLLPTGAKADTFLTDTPFDVVERKVALRADNHEYVELEVETRPQHAFTAISDGERGLAIVSSGQMESTVRDRADRPIAMTLFRGTRKTVHTDGEPNGQVLGKLNFRYFVTPVAGEPDRTRLLLLGQLVAAGLQVVQIRPTDQKSHGRGLNLAPTGGLLSMDGPAVVTSCRRVGNGLEVRFFNPLESSADVHLHGSGVAPLDKSYRSARFVNLESKPTGNPLQIAGNRLSVTLLPKQIVTVRLE